ncbi:hypothetical protein D3C80_1312570 [compost metagenome]
MIMQALVKRAIVDEQVGFQVQCQAQRVEIARAHRRPLIVNHCDFAVQRPLAIFMDLDAVTQQVVVKQARAQAHQRQVGHAL